MSRKSSRETAVVIRGVLYTNDEHTGARLDSAEWLEWLALGRTFYLQAGGWTARAEKRGRGLYWYAAKKIDGQTVKRYLGKLPTAEALLRLATP